MTMIRFTFDDGEDVTVISWTPEYGFMAAGKRAHLDCITFEEIDPRTGRAPVVAPQGVVTQAGQNLSPDENGRVPLSLEEPEPEPEKSPGDRCFACGIARGVHDDNNPEGCREFVD
jgi:hypothetical protein